MNDTYFSGYSPASKLWIFQANAPLLGHEAAIESHLLPFIQSWLSHGAVVQGSYHLVANRFLLIAASEAAGSVSGCSTDGLMRMVQALGTDLGLDFFDRTTLAFANETGHDPKINFVPLSEAKKGLPSEIAANSLYYDLTPSTVGQIQTGWPIQVQKSWLAKYLFEAAK